MHKTFPMMVITTAVLLLGAKSPTSADDRVADRVADRAADSGEETAVSTDRVPTERIQVELQTSLGKIVLELDSEKAPLSVKNFLDYAKAGHYDQTLFHRAIKDFMIQGGGRGMNLKAKPVRAPIQNEANNGLQNDEYTVAMARKPDPHSATDQFFINSGPENKFLNRAESDDGHGYTVFGKVIEGQDVVDQIESVPTRSLSDPDFPPRLMADVPVEPVVIESVKVLGP